jgi:hypothetical protein
MAREFISEYGLDPGEYIQQLVGHCLDRCQKFTEQTVEEAIFVDNGPINHLAWFALDDYDNHTFFYHDDSPNQDILQRFIFLSPSEQAMPAFKALLQKHYGVYRELEIATLLELPDTYLPQLGTRPRANLGICHNPADDRIVLGVSGTPRLREQEIFEDIDKIVPDRSFEKLITHAIQTIHTRIKTEADRHTISADISDFLEQDEDFRRETTKALPEGIHPTYTDTDAELWQKPASRVEYMSGSQGFLQIWLPTTEEECALIAATAGEYDRETIVDAIRKEFEAAVAKDVPCESI